MESAPPGGDAIVVIQTSQVDGARAASERSGGGPAAPDRGDFAVPAPAGGVLLNSMITDRPPPGVSSRVAVPPFELTRRCTIASPSPVPPGLAVVNLPNARARSLALMPGPSSATTTRTPPTMCAGGGVTLSSTAPMESSRPDASCPVPSRADSAAADPADEAPTAADPGAEAPTAADPGAEAPAAAAPAAAPAAAEPVDEASL